VRLLVWLGHSGALAAAIELLEQLEVELRETA
jgi:hypothetical protein